jgi:adenosylhomocysteine nucleosidase
MSSDRRPFAVLAALDVEAATLVRRLVPSEVNAPKLRVWEGDLEGSPVVLVLTGVGKVAASMATQFVCHLRRPRCIVAIGLAGAAVDNGARGRLIVASGAVQHDVDARPLTSARGMIAGLGMTVFPADPTLSRLLQHAAESVVERPALVRSSVVLTGDQIVASREVRERIKADFPDGACFDMETAAIAQVALQNGVPWVGLRITSDAADENFNLEEVLGFGASTAADLFDRIVRAFVAQA